MTVVELDLTETYFKFHKRIGNTVYVCDGDIHFDKQEAQLSQKDRATLRSIIWGQWPDWWTRQRSRRVRHEKKKKWPRPRPSSVG